jgi:endo-1,4-beta-xylanase
LDSLIAFVNELKTKGVKIDGIGTQMHISLNTSRAGIESMFKKLAATGLLVRVSELDILVNPTSATGFVLTQAIAESQAEMYQFVVQSYISNVPSSQRHGITVWGVMDASSWRYQNGKDFPLLYDNEFNKKPAYAGFLKALN